MVDEMFNENGNIKLIDVKPFTKFTPEMEKKFDEFAEWALPVFDQLGRDLEIIIEEEKEAKNLASL
jgi:hypothetical protein